jgi:hypothetical protein
LTRPLTVAAVDVAVVFAIAFAAAPYSCEGGLEIYFGTGVVSLIALIALPFFMAMGSSASSRVAWSAGFAAFAAVVWFAGLFLANVRIMCRLF